NDFKAVATKNMIQGSFSAEKFEPLGGAFLISTVYFKADWAQQFVSEVLTIVLRTGKAAGIIHAQSDICSWWSDQRHDLPLPRIFGSRLLLAAHNAKC
ncbi:hypothetical protein PENTCL1PPCAC_26229, partial [Pristionchus entomophagus]